MIKFINILDAQNLPLLEAQTKLTHHLGKYCLKLGRYQINNYYYFRYLGMYVRKQVSTYYV